MKNSQNNSQRNRGALDLPPEQRLENARKGGHATLAKGVGACGRSKQQMTADGIKGGSRGGPTTKARAVGIFAPGMQALGGRIAMHNRKHLALRRFNPKCELCVKELESQMRLVEIEPELKGK